jgi:hypothetical protein
VLTGDVMVLMEKHRRFTVDNFNTVIIGGYSLLVLLMMRKKIHRQDGVIL